MRRLAVGAGTGLAGAVLGVSSLAFACTSQIPFSVRPLAAPPNAAITVSGPSSSAPVDLRWDGVDGPVIAHSESASSTFALGARIPNAAPGMHTIVAVTRNADGTVTSRGQSPFEVTGAGAATVAAGWQSGPNSAAAARQVVTSGGSGSSQLAMGMGLLGAGSAALVGGFGVLAVRRRRALSAAVNGD